MKTYKDNQNQLHCIEPEFAHFLPEGCVEITDEEADAIRLSQIIPPTPNELILAQIAKLESTITNRRIREAALTEAGKAWLADVDSQITTLRGQLV